MLYTVVDRIYIGHIEGMGGLAITAVGLAAPLTQIVTDLGMLVGVGASASISLFLGKGNLDRAKKCLSCGIIAIWVISILTALLGNLFADLILRLFPGTDVTIDYVLLTCGRFCGALFATLLHSVSMAALAATEAPRWA